MTTNKRRNARKIESSIQDAVGLEQRVGDYAAAAVQKELLENEMNEKLVQIRKEYDEKLAAQEGVLNAIFADVQAYVTLNPGAIPGPRKSVDLVPGTIGYRTGNPRVTLPKGLDEAELCEQLRRDDELKGFVRIAEELDRKAVVAAGSAERELLAEYGVEVRQTERFFIDPRIDRSGP